MNSGVLPALNDIDSDTVLILAVAYILYMQNADISLILALLTVLL